MSDKLRDGAVDFPLLPAGWSYKKLGDLLQQDGLSYGVVQPGNDDPSGVPLVRVQNLHGGRVTTANTICVARSVEEKHRRTRLRGGEVLLSLVGSIGLTAVVPQELEGWNVNRAVAVIRPSPGVSSTWVKICLSAGLAQRCMSIWQTTTVQGTLNLRDVKELPIPMPPERERLAIERLLTALDDKIAVSERIIDCVHGLCSALFCSSFREALMHIVGREVMPEGWSLVTLGEQVTVLETGGRPKGGVAGYASGVPSIGAESISQLAKFDFAKVKFIPDGFFANLKRGVLQSHDILLYKDGGRPGNFQPHVSMFGNGFPFARASINEHVYRIRMAAPLSQAFGYFWLSSAPLMQEMRSRGTGVAIPGLNSSAVKDLPVVLPPADRLAEFDGLASPLVDRALSAALEAHSLGRLRDSLLPGLMSGAIRVRDAEKAVEDAT